MEQMRLQSELSMRNVEIANTSNTAKMENTVAGLQMMFLLKKSTEGKPCTALQCSNIAATAKTKGY